MFAINKFSMFCFQAGIDVLHDKDREIAALKEKLETATRAAEKFYTQYVTVRKTNLAYRAKIKRLRKADEGKNVAKILKRLRKDQFDALIRNSTRGMKWSTATIQDGLQYKMKWGTRGYTDFVQKIPIFPSARTLQEQVQHMPFDSGILDCVFSAFECQIPKLSKPQRVFKLVLDEMAIKPGEVFDPSVGRLIGSSTFPHHVGLAKKVVVFMLASLIGDAKFAVAYHFTSHVDPVQKKSAGEDCNLVGEALKNISLDIVHRAERIGARVPVMVADMGADNMAMRKAMGIKFNKKMGTVVAYIPHPERPNEKLWVLPDSVHLFKNILPCLSSNKVIYLPQDVVEEEGLISDEVNLSHLDHLIDFEKDRELKVAFRLQNEILHNKNQYLKMRVSSPRSVFNMRTVAALQAQAEVTGDPSILTTAFFVWLVCRWFELSTNRSGKMALRKSNIEEYEAALRHIRRTGDIFCRMRIGSKTNAVWKPVQSGMIVYCAGILELQDYLINVEHFIFVLLGLVTQDCIENLFALIRFLQAVPNALHFKQNLRVITLTQMCLTARNTNYAIDSVESLTENVQVDFLSFTKSLAEARKAENEVIGVTESSALSVPRVTMADVRCLLDAWELYVLYDIAGSVLRSLKKINISVCDDCYQSVLWHGEEQHPFAMVLGLKEYKKGCLLQVSDECFQAILKAEVTFRNVRDVLKTFRHVHSVQFLVDRLQYVWEGSTVPSCHDITSKILTRFLTMRFRIYGVKKRNTQKTDVGARYSSKTVGMHAAVE